MNKLAAIEPVQKPRVAKICDKLEERLVKILENTLIKDFGPLAETCWITDIFDRSVIWYLQELKPLRVLGTKFCNKIITELWHSGY